MPPKAEWKHLKRKRCKQCEELFKPARPEQRFCKTKCRLKWHTTGQGSGARLEKLIREYMHKMREEFRGFIAAEVRRALKEERAAARAKNTAPAE